MAQKKYEELKTIDVNAFLRDHKIDSIEYDVPDYITNNVKHSFFDWQRKAFEDFLLYNAHKKRIKPHEPTHLMFNMATGTGKTLLMASAILYYYNHGYRHFILAQGFQTPGRESAKNPC